jgi:hypothetical protein
MADRKLLIECGINRQTDCEISWFSLGQVRIIINYLQDNCGFR